MKIKKNIMRIISILCIIICCSCYHKTSSKYVLIISKQINNGGFITINQSKKICFKTDTNLLYTSLYFKENDFLKKFDSLDCTPYESFFYVFNNNNISFILIWETQYEHFSVTNAYLLRDDLLFKIGELEIVENCNSCEFYRFPIKELAIKEESNNIEFMFSRDVRYKIGKPDEQIIQAKRLLYIYEIQNRTLKVEKQ